MVSERQQYEKRCGGSAHVAPAVYGRNILDCVHKGCGWYSKGLEGGAEFRTTVNGVQSVQHLIDVIHEAFVDDVETMPAF